MPLVPDPSSPLGEFERARGRLLGLAYRMLGSRSEAEDVVQDCWLRWSGVNADNVENAEAYLVRVTTRLSLDRLKSARAQREVYVGPWLPEPVPDADRMSPETAAELADDLSFALLLALERLSPAERAAFLMHDVFDRSYGEVASSLGREQAACRKLVSRARKALKQERLPKPAPAEEHRRLLEAFVRATASGDVASFETFLSADAVAYSDGGGKVAAALNPIFGREKIARFVLGLSRKQAQEGTSIRLRSIDLNGRPGLLVYLNDALAQTMSLEIRDGRVERLFFVRNPDKLKALCGASASEE
jgi:RNA polymerase sigma-70 factor (ECF subfamily)